MYELSHTASEIPDSRCSSRDQRDSAGIRPWEWKPTHTVLSSPPPVRLSWSLPNTSASKHTLWFSNTGPHVEPLSLAVSQIPEITPETSLVFCLPALWRRGKKERSRLTFRNNIFVLAQLQSQIWPHLNSQPNPFLLQSVALIYGLLSTAVFQSSFYTGRRRYICLPFISCACVACGCCGFLFMYVCG